jgi:hypothetical protein
VEFVLFFVCCLNDVAHSINPGNDPLKKMTFQIAKQMRNFSYLIGDKQLKQVKTKEIIDLSRNLIGSKSVFCCFGWCCEFD